MHLAHCQKCAVGQQESAGARRRAVAGPSRALYTLTRTGAPHCQAMLWGLRSRHKLADMWRVEATNQDRARSSRTNTSATNTGFSIDKWHGYARVRMRTYHAPKYRLSRPRCRCAGGSRACRGAPTQSRALPGADPRRASQRLVISSPRCRSRGPLERRVPAVPPYPIPAPCPTRPTGVCCRLPCSEPAPAPRLESGPCRRCLVRQRRSRWVTCWTSRLRAPRAGCRCASTP